MKPFWDEFQLAEGALRPDTLTRESYERPTIVSWRRPHMTNPGDLYGQWRFHVPRHGVVATVRLFVIPNRLEEFMVVARVASEKSPYFSDPTLQGAAGERFQAALLRIFQLAVTTVPYPRAREAREYLPDGVIVHTTTPEGMVGYHMVIGDRESRKMLRDQAMVAVEVNSFAAAAARRAGFTLRHQDFTDAANRELAEMVDVQAILGEEDSARVTTEQLLRVAEATSRHAWRLFRVVSGQDDALLMLTSLQEIFYDHPVVDERQQAFCFIHSLLDHQLLTKRKIAYAVTQDDGQTYDYDDDDTSSEEDDEDTADPANAYWLSLQITKLAREFSGERTDLFVEAASITTKWKPNQKAPSPHFALLMNELHERHAPIAAFFEALFQAVQPRNAATEFRKPEKPIHNDYLVAFERLVASLDSGETWLAPLLHRGAFLKPDAPVYITEVILDYMKIHAYHVDPLYRIPRYRSLMMDHAHSERKTKSLLERLFF